MISDALGLSVPHLNKMLARLRNDRLVAVTDRRFELLDPPGLRMLAHFQPAKLARIPGPLKEGLDFSV